MHSFGITPKVHVVKLKQLGVPGSSFHLNGKSYPKVTKAVRLKQEELREKYAITPQKTGTMLWKIAETAFEDGHHNAAVSAIKELNQLAGLNISRSQNLNINANIDSMSSEYIKDRLAKILGAEKLDPDLSDH